MSSADGHKEAVRKFLRQRVPPFSRNKLVHDLCEDVIETFGSLYPDQALNLCMRIGQKITSSHHDGDIEKEGVRMPGKGRLKKFKARRKAVGS